MKCNVLVSIEIDGLPCKALVTEYEPAEKATEFEPLCGAFVDFLVLDENGQENVFLEALYCRLSQQEQGQLEAAIIKELENANA